MDRSEEGVSHCFSENDSSEWSYGLWRCIKANFSNTYGFMTSSIGSGEKNSWAHPKKCAQPTPPCRLACYPPHVAKTFSYFSQTLQLTKTISWGQGCTLCDVVTMRSYMSSFFIACGWSPARASMYRSPDVQEGSVCIRNKTRDLYSTHSSSFSYEISESLRKSDNFPQFEACEAPSFNQWKTEILLVQNFIAETVNFTLSRIF